MLVGAGPVALVGAGNMGRALIEGWIAGGLAADRIRVYDPDPPEPSRTLLAQHGIGCNPAPTPAPGTAVLVLAVKPQVMDAVLDAIRAGGLLEPGMLVLSVAAGRTIASIAARLGRDTAIVRTIPNTPAAIGRGMTVACANRRVGAAQKDVADRLLAAVGEVGWVDDEALIDAATAVSGSGPAYVFYLAECLAEAGVRAGLPRALAEQAARATVAGAGELMHRSALPAWQLRKNVTSPGGTTAAALEILAGENGLDDLVGRAVAAAARRASELSG